LKILIVYASSGSGHKKAAEGICDALQEEKNAHQVYLVDILDHTNFLLAFLYSKVYLFLIKNLRYVWAAVYYLTDNRLWRLLFGSIKLFAENISTKSFQKYLIKEKFDVIISTHFTSSFITGYLKRRKKIASSLITVVTDYSVHNTWIIKESDYFTAACRQTKEELVRGGIASDRIEISGIPVRNRFSIKRDSSLIRDKLKIEKKDLTVMVMGGGIGVGPYEYLLKRSLTIKDKVNILFVCGRNRKLYQRLEQLLEELKAPFKIYQFVDNIDELMQASDLIVTKAGGISITEALVKSLPMIITSAIPGQEQLNSRLMQKLGVMKIAETEEDVFDFIKEALDNPDILTKMRENIRRIAKPEAAKEVVDLAKRVTRDNKKD
jgi:processive 1,2-diacylglycerol beta-glucosyltransferase